MSKLYISITPEIKTIFTRTDTEVSGDSVEIDQLYEAVAKFNESHPDEMVEISSLMESAEIVRKERGPAQVDLSQLSEIEVMRLKADERKYQKSIENVVSFKTNNRSDFRSASESIAFASHFVLAFGSAFLLGYYLGEYLFEFERAEYKYMVGGACSFATLILESVLFIIRDQKQSRTPRTRKVEHRQTSVTTVMKTNQGTKEESLRQRAS